MSGFNQFLNWLLTWSEVIAGIGSLALTTGLVWLYFKQTKLQKDSLNREIRRSHTEVLRKRIQLWHGKIGAIKPEDFKEGFPEDNNLPTVTRADVRPAPAEVDIMGDERFRVIPEQLQGDRYLEDLLKNHAPDLKQSRDRIEDLYREFKRLRDDFIETYETDLDEKSVLEPSKGYERWIFERAVMIFRDNIDDDKEKLISIAESCVEEEAHGDNEKTVFPGARTTWSAGYKIEYDTLPREELTDRHEEFEEKAKEALKEDIESIEKDGVFLIASDAAEILDQIQVELRNLENLLIEYEGKPLFSGKCDYIEEAEV